MEEQKMNNIMKYRGYEAQIRYDDVVGVFSGVVQNINGYVAFEGYSVEELKNAFEKAIREYKYLRR
jgi:predicted HicB family RNase H-like nuclease